MAESVAVGVRVRPFNEREKSLKAELCISMDGPKTTLMYKGKENTFTFDESFWSHDGFDEVDQVMVPKPGSKYADQKMVFDAFGQRVLTNAWEGFHCCLFAYGQTGAGKSYSMVGYGKNKGIVPISCEEIFRRIEKNTNAERRFEITASMIEIYNETVQDLLILPQDRPNGGLPIHESKMLGVYVEGVRKTPVESYKAIEKVIDTATEHRTVGNTLMNATSSRAHTVLTIEFKQVEIFEGKETVKLSMINLVDLAGSEKSNQTGAAGDRLKEGCMINKSLSALGNVIEKLAKKSNSKGKGKDIVVPYRDSKLTRLLQNALGGSSKTIMICALSPASSNAEETLSTLRYADRAKQIKNVATINEDPQGKLLREMKEENEKLKDMMASLSGGGAGSVDVSAMQARIAELAMAEQALQEMQRSFTEKVQEAKEIDCVMEAKGRQKGWDGSKYLPHIVNLNEDLELSGKLKYFFEEGKTYNIGNRYADSDSEDEAEETEPGSQHSTDDTSSSSSSEGEVPPDIGLSGHDILKKHATMTNVNGECQVHARGRAAQATFVNGRTLEALLMECGGHCHDESLASADEPVGITLKHGNRVTFGKMIFVFINPDEGTAEQELLKEDLYSRAREELRGGVLSRMKTLGIFLADPSEPCGGARNEEQEKEVEDLKSQLAEARAELARTREELAAVKRQPMLPSQPGPPMDAHEISGNIKESFEHALGALDSLSMRLLTTKTKSKRVSLREGASKPLF